MGRVTCHVKQWPTQTGIKIKFWTKFYLTTMGRCLKKGDRLFFRRTGHLVIMPKPQLCVLRGTALRHSHTHHLPPILVQLNH